MAVAAFIPIFDRTLEGGGGGEGASLINSTGSQRAPDD